MWYSSFWSEGPRNHLNWQNLVQYFVPCCVDLRGISGAASPDPWRQNLGKRKVKGSKKAIFAVIWGGFEGFGTCLGISHPTHPHLGKISPKKRIFYTFPYIKWHNVNEGRWSGGGRVILYDFPKTKMGFLAPVCPGQTWPSNQTKLSEFRLRRISRRIPKRGSPG